MNDEQPKYKPITWHESCPLPTEREQLPSLLTQEDWDIIRLVNYPYAVVEKACQELCSRHTCTVNETLSKLLCSDVDTRREFFAIIQEQQNQ